MSPGIEHVEVSYGEIHFSEVYPVKHAECGERGPSTANWAYVTCLNCLRLAPDEPEVRRRIEEVLARKAAQAG